MRTGWSLWSRAARSGGVLALVLAALGVEVPRLVTNSPSTILPRSQTSSGVAPIVSSLRATLLAISAFSTPASVASLRPSSWRARSRTRIRGSWGLRRD